MRMLRLPGVIHIGSVCDQVVSIFAELNYHCNFEPQRAVRTSRYV